MEIKTILKLTLIKNVFLSEILNYNNFYDKGKIGKKLNNYSSDSGTLLSSNEITKILLKLDFVKKHL